MKIALIDNMNNSFFALGRYLRDFGLDAHLFYMPATLKHFYPQADTTRDVAALPWVHLLPYDLTVNTFFRIRRKQLQKFKEFDLRVVCGFVPAFFDLYKIPVDLFIPYGSDLYQLPFLETDGLGPIRRWQYRKFSRHQLLGIQSARAVIVNTQHRVYREAAEKLNIQPINLNLLAVYNREDYSKLEDLWCFLDDHDFVLFNHSRHIWKSNPDNFSDFAEHGGNKRNDKVIRAFARFLQVTRFKKPLLLTFEYGEDVAASKELVHDLGIGNWVRWMPLSNRITIMAGLKRASLCTDMFRYGNCGIGGTGYEALASGVPLLTYTHGALANPSHPFYNAPIIDVLEEDEIFSVLTDYEANPQKYVRMGEMSKAWFEEHLGSGLVKKYIDLLERLASAPHQHLAPAA